MKHPEIVLLPLLMFSDYFLTVLGSIQREKKCSDHFKVQHYELNPIWQESIKQRRWLNPRQILLTVLVSGALAGMLELGDVPEPLADGLLGCLFVSLAGIIGRHLANILFFRRLLQDPEQISGQVAITHSLALASSNYSNLGVAIPVAMIAVFSPTPFVFGALVGTLMMFVVHFDWIQRNKKDPFNAQDEAKSFAPEPGTASLYVLRGHGPGSGRLFTVVLDGRSVGWLTADTYHLLSVTSGRHILTVGAKAMGEGAEEVEVIAVAGQNYFYFASLGASFRGDQVHVKLLRDAEGRKKIFDMRRAVTRTHE